MYLRMYTPEPGVKRRNTQHCARNCLRTSNAERRSLRNIRTGRIAVTKYRKFNFVIAPHAGITPHKLPLRKDIGIVRQSILVHME